MTLKGGLTLSILFHMALFTSLLGISLGEGGKRAIEGPILVRLAEEMDVSEIRVGVGRGMMAKEPMHPHNPVSMSHEDKGEDEDVKAGNGALISGDDGVILQGGTLPSSDNDGVGSYASANPSTPSSIPESPVHVEGDGGSGSMAPTSSSSLNTIELIKGLIENAKRYPALARKRGIEGTVHVSFRIDRDGKPYDIKVINASGFSILDNEAIEIIKRAGTFPHTDMVIEVPISFRLNKE
ncbi:MAG: hypothetical protein Fur0020_03000 [Thermodesulfovibrionia bacterium]